MHSLASKCRSKLDQGRLDLLNQSPWQTVCNARVASCMISDPLPINHQYYQSGDLTIAGILSQFYMFFSPITFRTNPSLGLLEDLMFVTPTYQHLLALVFAVNESNKNLLTLSNLTLGFHIYNSNFVATWTFRATIDLLSTWGRFLPNYKCDNQQNVVAVIGGPNSDECFFLATMLHIYKIPQLGFGSFPVMTDESQGTFFQRMFPTGDHQYMGILRLLLAFRWTWIGVIIIHDQNGQRFVQTVLPKFSQRGICFEFIATLPTVYFTKDIANMVAEWIETYNDIMSSTANVVVINGESHTMIFLRMFPKFSEVEDIQIQMEGKVWIMTAQMESTSIPFQRLWDIDILHGALSFAIHSKDVPGFQQFLQRRNPTSDKEDGFIREFWQQAFSCVFLKKKIEKQDDDICSGEEKLESLPGSVFELGMSSHSYNVYNAVHAVAHALRSLHLSKSQKRVWVHGKRWEQPAYQAWQLHQYLRSASFNNAAGEEVSLDKNGNLLAGFDILNWLTFSNLSFIRVKVGKIDSSAPEDKMLSINVDAMMWPRNFNGVQPVSLCSQACQLGYRKRKKEGEPFCCYDCFPCPQGKISSHMALVLGIFVRHRDTPIVKANNRNLTLTLLVSLLLSFLCALLFIGQPNKLTCLLRQTAFVIIFSVAISCVLAKTITVVLAFMATKPGSRMGRWVGTKLANSIVLSCSLIQAMICIIWLATSPPFPDFDMQSMTKEIILECNQGSVTMFYCVLGFMGFLAMVSFMVAFLGRKLPDSFNEAKFITLSMLVFCSVWLTFVPTYLSTKGKSMVAVEIFSILSSSAGLLGCIFPPKCYIIVMHPDLNSRHHLMRKTMEECRHTTSGKESNP
ncbi:hypothetical protein EYD10_17961 [Varanus komodoensis]|nr:hypothetical protein EYD10_17961 [Varanus komodoensis]